MKILQNWNLCQGFGVQFVVIGKWSDFVILINYFHYISEFSLRTCYANDVSTSTWRPCHKEASSFKIHHETASRKFLSRFIVMRSSVSHVSVSFFFDFSIPQPTSPPSSSSTYRINATNGNTCILITTDGLLSIQYRDKMNEDKEADVYLPDNPGLDGKKICSFTFLFIINFYLHRSLWYGWSIDDNVISRIRS